MICNNAFTNCRNLTRIELPDSLRTIENDAFSNTAIESICIPDGVLYVGSNIVSCCDNLIQIDFPESLIETLDGAFNKLKVYPKYDEFDEWLQNQTEIICDEAQT